MLWIIGVVIGGVVLLGGAIWLILCIYFSCTRVPKQFRKPHVMVEPPAMLSVSDISADGDKAEKVHSYLMLDDNSTCVNYSPLS